MKPIKYSMILMALVAIPAIFSGCKKDDYRRPNSVKILSLDPESPASLDFGEFAVITTDYYKTRDGGARYWVQPYTDGEISPGYLYSRSGIFDGSGKREVGIQEKPQYPGFVGETIRWGDRDLHGSGGLI
jgi:hypothetical protein